jgi:cob(I)alamin adenosyltransferase
MAYRLTRITTRTGDDGTTGLADGRRLTKSAPAIELLGVLDEVNAQMGVVLTESMPADVQAWLIEIQNRLFDLGTEIAVPGRVMLRDGHLTQLDACITEWNATLPPLREFVLPGGTRAAAHLHVARTVCRRAERAAVAHAEVFSPESVATPWLNRLSDALFVASRVVNMAAGQPEPTWRPMAETGPVGE